MKKLILINLLIITSINLFGQKDNAGSGLKTMLQEVLRAAAEDFISLRGDQISGETGTISYLSTLSAPGSQENRIIGYNGPKKTDWVWESKLNNFEDIKDLQKQYKKIYTEISRGSVKGNAKTYEPLSEYENPTEDQRIWTNQFKVVSTQLIIDLVAEQQYNEWVIWLRVYNLENLAGAPSR
ncbi:MAG: hypothetical protein ACK5BV_09795 [Bacteroidota bacterium]|jgi:hypothetical protein